MNQVTDSYLNTLERDFASTPKMTGYNTIEEMDALNEEFLNSDPPYSNVINVKYQIPSFQNCRLVLFDDYAVALPKVLRADLVILHMTSGGVRIVKDRYNRYGTNAVYFAE